MNTNVFTTVIIGVMVSALILVAFVPVFNEVSSTTDTFDNSGFARSQMKELADGDSWIRSDGVWYYEDEEVTSGSSGNYSILFTDNMVVREIANVRGINVSYSSNGVTSIDVSDGDTSLELTYNQSTTASYEFSYGYGAVAEGDYILKTTSSSAYVLKDTTIYLTGITSLTGANTSEVICTVAGSIEDGFTVSVAPVKNGTATNLTIGEITVNATEVSGYVDLYKLTNITFDIGATYNDEEVTYNATYSTFVMPKEVTAEKSVHGGSAFNAVIDIIPLVAGVGLLMGAVYYFISRR